MKNSRIAGLIRVSLIFAFMAIAALSWRASPAQNLPRYGSPAATPVSNPFLFPGTQGDLPPCPHVCLLVSEGESAEDTIAQFERANHCRVTTGDTEGAPVVETGLGADVDAVIMMSPTFTQYVLELLADGWQFVYGPVDGGSKAKRAPDKIIVIDGGYQGKTNAVLSTLAHEVGHARYAYTPNYSSKDAYLSGVLADEGEATLVAIELQRDIIAHGGPQFGVNCNQENLGYYNSTYDTMLVDGNRNAARQAIGERYKDHEIASGGGVTYGEYYGGWYDRNFPSP